MQLLKEEYARKRIHNGSSVKTENSVTWVTVQHHSASRERGDRGRDQKTELMEYGVFLKSSNKMLNLDKVTNFARFGERPVSEYSVSDSGYSKMSCMDHFRL